MGNKLLGSWFFFGRGLSRKRKQSQSSVCERDEVSGQGGLVLCRDCLDDLGEFWSW